MNLTRILPRPQVAGMGAVKFTDTGDGITPANFQQACCTGLFNGQPELGSIWKCNSFKSANEGRFGGYSPCSTDGIASLNYPTPIDVVPRTSGPPLPIDTNPESPTYGMVITNPCTGSAVETSQDAADLQTCIAKRGAEENSAAVMRAMRENAAGQCAAMKVDCANRALAMFLSPSEDCTDCTFDWAKPGSLFLIAGGLLVGGLILVKLLK